MTKKRIIIGTDPGVDDLVALIAFFYAEFEILGLTSIGGNVDHALTLQNLLGIRALADRPDIPVFIGAKEPLLKAAFTNAAHVHGDDGLQGFVLPHDRAGAARTDMDAADFIISESLKYKDDPITLVWIGPLTDVAIAYERDPTLVDRIAGINIMGGAYGNPSGNIGLPTQNGQDKPYFQEFNNGSDRRAAEIVYKNFHNIHAFPLDVTYKTLQGPEFREWLRSMGKKGENLADMLEKYSKTEGGVEGIRAPLHDFNTAAAMVALSLYMMKRGFVSVVQTGENQGQTIFTPDENGNVSVAFSVDAEGVNTLLKEMLTPYLMSENAPKP